MWGTEYCNLDELSCNRGLILGSIAFIIFIFSIFVFYKSWKEVKNWYSRRIIILFLTTSNLLLILIHYFFFHGYYYATTSNALSIIIYILICDFFASICATIFKTRTFVGRWIITPIKLIMILYILIILIISYTRSVTEKRDTCTDVIWLLFSCSQFAMTFSLMFAGWFIFLKLGKIKTSGSTFNEKKNQLLILVVVNFAASTINLAYEICNREFLSSENCDKFFEDQNSNNALYLVQRILVLLVPLIALLLVFYNWRKTKETSQINPTPFLDVDNEEDGVVITRKGSSADVLKSNSFGILKTFNDFRNSTISSLPMIQEDDYEEDVEFEDYSIDNEFSSYKDFYEVPNL